jgi:hypothetical protein
MLRSLWFGFHQHHNSRKRVTGKFHIPLWRVRSAGGGPHMLRSLCFEIHRHHIRRWRGGSFIAGTLRHVFLVIVAYGEFFTWQYFNTPALNGYFVKSLKFY